MYIIIFEDNSVKTLKSISDNEINSVFDGYCSLIDISDPNNPTEFDPNENSWVPVESADIVNHN